MKRVLIRCGDAQQTFGFSDQLNDEELKQLVRLEFAIPDSDELSLCERGADGNYTVLPFSVRMLDNRATYLLRVYNNRSKFAAVSVLSAHRRVAVSKDCL